MKDKDVLLSLSLCAEQPPEALLWIFGNEIRVRFTGFNGRFPRLLGGKTLGGKLIKGEVFG